LADIIYEVQATTDDPIIWENPTSFFIPRKKVSEDREPQVLIELIQQQN
jgi:hypothetical protein